MRIGFVGVGMMGHGAAKNIVEKGFPLSILGHRNRQPVEDLIRRGATEAKTATDMARGTGYRPARRDHSAIKFVDGARLSGETLSSV